MLRRRRRAVWFGEREGSSILFEPFFVRGTVYLFGAGHVLVSVAELCQRVGFRAEVFDETDFVQPAVFSLQMALAAAWRARGVEPDAVVGQSLGEVAAACVAGSLGIEDAALVICTRSQLVMRATGQGSMAVLGLSLEAAGAALAPFRGQLSVAVSSGPEETVVSGDEEAMQALLDDLYATDSPSTCPHGRPVLFRMNLLEIERTFRRR